MPTPIAKTYTVKGMSCGHCKAAVTDEVQRVAGVDTVEVDLEAATLTVHGDQIDEAAIRDAVDEAGYEVVS